MAPEQRARGFFQIQLSNNIFTSWLRTFSKISVPFYSYSVFSQFSFTFTGTVWFVVSRWEKTGLCCAPGMDGAYEELAGTARAAVTRPIRGRRKHFLTSSKAFTKTCRPELA